MYKLLLLAIVSALAFAQNNITKSLNFDVASLRMAEADKVRHAKGDSMAFLLSAVGTSDCVRNCTRIFGIASSEFFEFDHTVDKIGPMCEAYKEASQCLKQKDCEGAEMFNGPAAGLEQLCTNKYPTIQSAKPCLRAHADRVLNGCNERCAYKSTLKQLLESENVQELAEDGGNEIVLLESLGPTCRAFMCFLACVHQNLNAKCLGMGFLFVESALLPVEETVQMAQSGGLLSMVASSVPGECQPFLEKPKIAGLKYLGIDPSGRPTVKLV